MSQRRKKVPRQIARKLIILVVLFSTVITLLTTVYQLYADYSQDVDQIHHRLDEIQVIHLPNIAKLVWVADHKDMQQQLNNLLNLPRINYLEIIEGSEITVFAGSKDNKDVIERSYQITYQHRGKNLLLGNLNVQASLQEVYQHLIDTALSILIGNAIKTFLVTGFIFIIFELLITRHLHEIADYAGRLDLNNLQDRLKLPGKKQKKLPDELDVVVQAFDKMQDNLRQSVEKLEQKDAYIRVINNSIAAAILGVDENGVCQFANQMCLKQLGYQQYEVLGKNVHELLHPAESNIQSCINGDCYIQNIGKQDCSSVKGEIYKTNEPLVRKDGSQFYAEYWIHPVKQGSKLTGCVISFIDITDRYKAEKELDKYQIQLERLVKERTSELQQMYDELESFSYSVSHDLRAPLRAINGFSLILKEDNTDQLDQDGLQLLDKICAAADNMGALIDSLLGLSRITRHSLNLQTIDASGLARRVFANLIKYYEREDAELTIEDNITIHADDGLVKVAFENICNNAIKFSSVNSDIKINVSKIVTDTSVIVVFEDNGVGFDMAHKDQLFKPFHRLHDAGIFKGHGIGLATVARVMKRHNGRVWAEGVVEKGAKFFLEFPRVSG